MRLLDRLRALWWRPRPWESWYVSPRRVPASTRACTWCGGMGADDVREDTGDLVHGRDTRPWCLRVIEHKQRHGERT